MKIVCPQCQAWYEIPAASLGRGRPVRCAECRTVWTPSAEDAARAEEALRREASERQARDAALAASAAAAAAPAFATAGAGPDFAPPTNDTAPPADDDDGWPADLSPPKETAAPDEADASPGTVDDAPSVVPGHDPYAVSDAPARDWDAEFEAAEARRLAREEAKPRTRRWSLPKPSWTTVVLALMVAIGIVLAWRVDVVRMLPQTGSLFAGMGLPVNLRGLAFGDVTIETDTSDKVPVVVVQGVVVNVSKVRIEVPRLRFSMRDGRGAEIYTWTALPQKAVLAPGEAQPFRTRLASPPADSREILVRFFTRRDR